MARRRTPPVTVSTAVKNYLALHSLHLLRDPVGNTKWLSIYKNIKGIVRVVGVINPDAPDSYNFPLIAKAIEKAEEL